MSDSIAVGMGVLEAMIDGQLARATRLPPIGFVLDGQAWTFDTRNQVALFSPGLVPDAGLTVRCSAGLFWRMFSEGGAAPVPGETFEATGSTGLLRQLAQLFRAPKKAWAVQFT